MIPMLFAAVSGAGDSSYSDVAAGDGSCDLLGLTIQELHNPYSPIQLCCLVCLFIIILVFVVSELSGNYSQTDKLWSITPFVFAWILVCDARTLLMAVISTIWGSRLTYNFARRGGYKWPPWEGDEDYRWKHLQDGFLVTILQNKVAWILFNFWFISVYQHVLLLVVVAPAAVAHIVATKCPSSTTYSSSLNALDGLGCLLYLGFVYLESVADDQQLVFQTEKYRRRALGGDALVGEYRDGFTRSGLFSIVRKPNYACEQALWVSFGIFSVSAFAAGDARQANLWNWSHAGWVFYVLLFQGSGPFTERITLAKYPSYVDYTKETPLYIPNVVKLLFGPKSVPEKKNE